MNIYEKNKSFFDTYGTIAEIIDDEILMSGRHGFHKNAIKIIVEDIRNKLNLNSSDKLLEIGCGAGLLLRYLAQYCHLCVGQDHLSLLNRFEQTGKPGNEETSDAGALG